MDSKIEGYNQGIRLRQITKNTFPSKF
jgi:hypothetical protein